jgi:hypothetical protein
MAVWCPDYGDGRPLSHTYDNKPRSRRSYYWGEVASRREPPRRVQVDHPTSVTTRPGKYRTIT